MAAHDGRFLHHQMLTVNGDSEKGGKNEACCGGARSDESEQRRHSFDDNLRQWCVVPVCAATTVMLCVSEEH